MHRRLAACAPMAFILIASIILIGWNASRFIGAQSKIRTKNLDFLPSPIVAKVLSIGQASTVAKLRWIDSFSYFQYQLDVKNDHVSGDDQRGGLYRLYDTLTSLDPYFNSFYEHAALNLSGVLGNHQSALSFLMRGIEALPHDTVLWRNTAAHLKMFYHYEQQHPGAFDDFLAAWEDAEVTDNEKMTVMHWKKEMAKRTFKGLEQLSYWFDRLERTKPKSPVGDYVEETIRTQIAMYGQQELNALLDDYRRMPSTTGSQPVLEVKPSTNVALTEALRLEVVPTQIEDLVNPRLVTARYHGNLPAFGPVERDALGQFHLKPDPFGYSWSLTDGHIQSLGLQRLRYNQTLVSYTSAMTEMAKTKGAWPSSIEELREWGIAVPHPPVAGTLRVTDQQIQVDWTAPPYEPLRLR